MPHPSMFLKENHRCPFTACICGEVTNLQVLLLCTMSPPFFYIFIRESTDPIQLHPETGLYSCILTRKWAGTVQEEHTHLCIDHSTSTKRHLNTKTFLIATHCPYHLIPVSSSLNFASKVSLFNLL